MIVYVYLYELLFGIGSFFSVMQWSIGLTFYSFSKAWVLSLSLSLSLSLYLYICPPLHAHDESQPTVLVAISVLERDSSPE